ncbi:MAG: SMC-Scp complex subunit ScpB [Candidatus Aenigmatarchaeota archaeon]
MNNEQKQINKLALLEAMLFTTDEPLSIQELEKNLKMKKEEIEKLLSTLKEKYNSNEFGIKLSDVGGFKLVVKSEYASKVSHLTPHADLSRGLLRVLSIIAYHEPISQSDIVKVIGNRTYEYVKELEERGLIKSEKKSRTKLLRTTSHFEEYFGARREELKKMFEETKKDKKNIAEKNNINSNGKV